VFGLVMGLLILPPLIGRPHISDWWIKGLLVLLAASLIPWAASIVLLVLSRQALFRADYDRALRLMKAVPQPEFRGVILNLAGRPKEAEGIFAKLARESRDPKQRARRLDLLAKVLMDQGRWDQAKETLEEAIRVDIGLGQPLLDAGRVVSVAGNRTATGVGPPSNGPTRPQARSIGAHSEKRRSRLPFRHQSLGPRSVGPA